MTPTTRSTLALLALGFLATAARAQSSPSPSASPTAAPMQQLAEILQKDPQALAQIERNQTFLETPLDEGLIDRLRTQLGRGAVDDRMDLDRFQGRSVADVLKSDPRLFQQNPQLLMALASQRGTGLYTDNTSASPVEVSEPARVIPAKDVKDALTGPTGSPERFREYLRKDYGLTDTQVSAYEAFISMMEEEDPAGLQRGGQVDPESAKKSIEGIDKLSSSIRGQDIPDATGLYLPAMASLQRMEELLGFMRDYDTATDKNPETFRARDGRSLMELVAAVEPDPQNQLSNIDAKGMNPGAVRGELMRLMRGLARRERNGPNGYLFEQGLAFLLKRSGEIKEMLEKTRQKALPDFVPIGNGRIAELNENFYRRLMQGPKKRPDQRDLEELLDPDAVFAVRGHPRDLYTSSGEPRLGYDPPTAGKEMYTGAGLNLDNTP